MDKRDPAIYLKISEILGFPSSELLIFEDSPQAISGAKKAGLKVIGVQENFFKEYEEQIKENADFYITTFMDFLDNYQYIVK